MKRLVAFLTILLLYGLAVASAQSLVEMAKQEKERREKNDTTQVKSFSDTDLTDFRGTLLTGSTPAADTAEEPGESAELEEEDEEEDPTQTEVYWRKNMRLADFYTEPGQFVALPAMEWTLRSDKNLDGIQYGAGHYNVIFASAEESKKFIRNEQETLAFCLWGEWFPAEMSEDLKNKWCFTISDSIVNILLAKDPDAL